ncbi:MAG: hypothetical protein JSV26_11755 [bacterium]|nr:MAG: hypothetical protein JSV26_11755 [bacterium]
MKMKVFITAFIIPLQLILSCILSVPEPATAGELNSLYDTTYKLHLGAFLPRMKTKTAVDPSNPLLPPGDLIDMENDFGLEKDLTLGRLDGYFRLGRRHRIQAGYFTLKRDGSRVINRNITFGDITFPLNATVESEAKNSILEVGYMYSIVQNERFELSGTFGVHWLDVETRLTGDTGGGIVETESASAAGPLPLFGLDVDYALGARWILSFRAMRFAIEIDEYDGSLTDLRASIEYFFLENFGVGLGVNDFDLDVDFDGARLAGELEWGYTGLQVFATLRF